MDNRKPRLKTTWTQDLKTASEREEFTKVVLNSSLVLDKLRKIVYNRVISGEKVAPSDYDSPSWSHKQADSNGYARAYREILELLDFNGDHDQ